MLEPLYSAAYRDKLQLCPTMNKHQLLIVLLLLIPVFSLSGQEVLPFGSMDKLNGLSNNTVNDIKQDTTGYLWVATNKGLNRFDGLAFKAYQTNTRGLLQSDYVLSLLVDRQNRLWFGTFSGGLYYLNIATDELHVVANDLLEVNAIIEADQSTFWIGAGNGLYWIQVGQEGQYAVRKIADLHVRAIIRKGGDLWLGTSSGLYFLDGTSLELSVIAKGPLQGELIFDIEVVKDRELWIATRHQGVLIYEIETGRLLRLEDKLGRQPALGLINVRELLQSKDHKIHIGTDGAGLIVYDLQSQVAEVFTKGKNDNSILSNTIFSMFEDEGGNIWLGHIRKGISVINNDRDDVDIFFRDELEGDYSSILCIHQDADGGLLCGTDGKGLFELDPSTNQYEDLNGNPVLSQAYVQSIFRDSQNRLWVGTFSNGVFVRSAPGSFKALGTAANDIRGFCEDREGNIWIATNGQGVFKFPSGNGVDRTVFFPSVRWPGTEQQLHSLYEPAGS